MKGRGRRIALGGLGVVLALGLVLFLARGWIVASLAGPELAEAGLRCDPLVLTPSWDLSEIEIDATTCTVADAPVSRIELPGGAKVSLDGTRPREIRVPTAVVDLETELPFGGLMGAVLADGEMPPQMRRAIDGLAEASTRDDLPAFTLGTMSLRRGPATLTLQRLEVRPDGETLRVSAAAFALPPFARGPIRVLGRLADLRATATPADVTIEGRLEAEVELGRAEQTRGIRITAVGRDLDGTEPRYALDVEGAARLQQILERLGTLRARMQERREAGPERLRALRERLEGARERMQESREARDPGAGASRAE